MERDFIKEKLKNWQEETPVKVKQATQIAFAKLPASKNKSRRAWTAIAACACFMAFLLVTPVGGYALAAIQSVFDMFAQQRYADPEQNKIVSELDQNAQSPTQQEIGRTGDEEAISAKVDGVFYDGVQLVISYSIEGLKSFDAAYKPSAEELAGMYVLEKDEVNMDVHPNEGVDNDAMAEIIKKVEVGQSAGWRSYDLHINDGTYTKDGVDVPASMDDYFYNGDQKVGVRYYALTDELKQRDMLTLDIGFTVWETRYYFDGNKAYYSSKACESQTVEVMAKKEPAVQGEGVGEFKAYTAKAALTVSPVFITVKIELAPLGNSSAQKAWLEHYKSEFNLSGVPTSYRILDADGNVIAENPASGSITTQDDHAVMELSFAAVKDLPKQLILRPIFSGGETTSDQDIYVTLP